jgi:hypothetical protein
MNQYAIDAKAYLDENLPSLASSMTSQDWNQLGESLNNQIGNLAAQLAGPDPPDEPHLDKVARLNTARMRATEIVMHEQVYSRPPEVPEEENDPEIGVTGIFQGLNETRALLA